MQLKKNIKLGRIKLLKLYIFISLILFIIPKALSEDGDFVDIKILDKVSSKTSLLSLNIKQEKTFENLIIKVMKCKNSEFDDNPEITAYLQVRDLADKNNNEVFIFNDWMFSSSPSITPFDHPVYDVWLVDCY